MSSTGYGPRSDSRRKRLTFNGDEKEYESWEAKFLGHLPMLKLKTTILPSEDLPDEAKNEECYAELIQFLDGRSLSLVMRDAADDSRKALKILREHHARQNKPRIIMLYTELTSLEMGTNEAVTEYLIRAEKTITALRNAKKILSDGLIIAMILKGLPHSYKPLAIHITQSTSEITFTEFKVQLRSFEETEKFNTKEKADQVMKTVSPTSPVCYGCRQSGHFIKPCPGNLKRQSGAVITRAPLSLTANAKGTTGRTEQNKSFSATQPKPLKGNTPLRFMSKVIQTDIVIIRQDYWLTQELHPTLSQLTFLKEWMELSNRQNIAWSWRMERRL